MFTIYLTNFGYWHQQGRTFETLDAARCECRRIGFECAIYRDDELVTSFSPISGFRDLRLAFA
jgi:hypothetical protein